MVIFEVQAITTQFSHLFATQESLEVFISQLPGLGTVLAQNISDPDVLGQMQAAFKNFIDSGQVWALLIGLFLGYTFRGFTSYGR